MFTYKELNLTNFSDDGKQNAHEMNISCIIGCKQVRYENNLITFHSSELQCALQVFVDAQIALIQVHYYVSLSIRFHHLMNNKSRMEQRRPGGVYDHY